MWIADAMVVVDEVDPLVHGAKARGTTASTRGVMVLEVDRANFFGYPRSKNTNKKWIIRFF